MKSNKIKDFVKKIKYLTKDKTILNKMKNKSINSTEIYDLTLVTKKLLKLYGKII